MTDRGGFIYAIKDERGNVKLGFSKTPSVRLYAARTIQRKEGGPIEFLGFIPAPYSVELWFHSVFAKSAIRGREWHAPDSAAAQIIGMLPFMRKKYGEKLVAYNSESTHFAWRLEVPTYKLSGASEMGRKGGKARIALLNPEERKALARSGGLAKAAKRGQK